MPLYEYEDKATGKTCEMYRPVKQRDDCPSNLRRVISPIGFRMGAGRPDPSNVDIAAPAGLREMEQEMGTSGLEKAMGMSAKQLKKIWNT